MIKKDITKIEDYEPKDEKINDKIKGLADLILLKINVPKGFIIPESVYEEYTKTKKIEKKVIEEIIFNIEEIEKSLDKKFGEIKSEVTPLLFSIRCGEKNIESYLPNTILNVGITVNDINTFYKSLYDQFNDLISNIHGDKPSISLVSEEPIDIIINTIYLIYDKFIELDNEGLEISDYSLIIQQMVYGNINDKSVSGSCYTRNPYTMNDEDYGKYLKCKTGHLLNVIDTEQKIDLTNLKYEFPECYAEIKKIFKILEEHYDYPRYLEFVIEDNKLFIVQNVRRNSKLKLKNNKGKSTYEKDSLCDEYNKSIIG